MLSDTAVRKAKKRDAPYKMADSGGLYLLVTATGAKSWRMKFMFDKKEGGLTFGLWPDVGIVEARDRRDEARRMLRDGLNPSVAKKKAAAVDVDVRTFEISARAWHANETPRWRKHHAKNVLAEMERDIFPLIGKRPLATIDAPAILLALRTIEARGALDAARRARQRMSAVFVFGIAESWCVGDPAAIIVKAMAPRRANKKRPAIVTLDGARKILRDVEAIPAYAGTQLAIRFLALTAVRPGELTGSAWIEFEALGTAKPLWRIPKERMKAEDDKAVEHLVPLSRQAVEVLAALRTLTGRGPLPFPNTRWAHKPMSENTMGYLLNRAGYKGIHVPHGFRSTFSTLMNEAVETQGRDRDRAIIDLMLAHVPKDVVEGIYNRAAYMPRRRQIAQEWADMLTAGLPPAAALLSSRRSGAAKPA